MPTNSVVKFAVGFEGVLTGTSANADLSSPLTRQAILTSFTGTGKQVYMAWNTPLSITAGSTTTLNLLTGLTNPLNEAIGTTPFTKVLGILIQHDEASVSATIEAFGGASLNLFQGPLNAAAKATLRPGQWIAFGIPADKTGDTTDATHKNIDLKNTGALTATVNVFILGITT